MKRTVLTTTIGALTLAALLGAGPAGAADKPKGKPGAADAAAAAEKPEKPFTEWKKLTKDAEAKPGFFTLWKKRDNLYLEIAPDQLGKPFLYVVSISRGIGSNFVLGGISINYSAKNSQEKGARPEILPHLHFNGYGGEFLAWHFKNLVLWSVKSKNETPIELV